MRKGKVLAKYASFEMKKRAAFYRNEIGQCILNKRSLETTKEQLRRQRHRDLGTDSDSWVACTIDEWTGNSPPPTGEGPYWAKGTGTGLKVRSGPNYRKHGNKVMASGSMYEAMCLDMLKSNCRLQSVMGTLVEHPPQLQEYIEESDCAGGIKMRWSPECPLPRVICINLMLPYESGLNPFGGDAGCSAVSFFHIKPEIIQLSKLPNPPPHVKLLKDFCAGPAGKPGGPVDDPARSLAARLRTGVKKDHIGGLFKVAAFCLNSEDIQVPEVFHTYNGKPCIAAKCGYVVKDPLGEWIEIGVDVRGFNVFARKMLGSYRHLLVKTKLHFGFWIQGVEDHELPEALLGDIFAYGLDMMNDPLSLDQQSTT